MAESQAVKCLQQVSPEKYHATGKGFLLYLYFNFCESFYSVGLQTKAIILCMDTIVVVECVSCMI